MKETEIMSKVDDFDQFTEKENQKLIVALEEARQRVEEAEVEFKRQKAGLCYIEEVIWFTGEKTLRTELGTLSIGTAKYASILKRNFIDLDRFLQKQFGIGSKDFLEPTLTSFKQKKLAKLLEDINELPKMIKIFEKPSLRLRKKKVED